MPDSKSYRAIVIDLCVLLAGLSVPLAFAPYNLSYLLYPALVVLLYGWHVATPARAFWRGYLFGFAQFGFGVYWLHISINLFGGVSLFLALLATYMLVAFLALYPAVTGWLLRRYFSRAPIIALLLVAPALWILSEWLRSWLLTGFPWLNLGYSQIDTPLAGIAPVLGVYGTGWVVMIIAALLTSLLLIRHWQKRPAAILAVVVIFGGVSGLQRADWVQPASEPLEVALIQGAIPQEIKWQSDQLERTMRLYHDLSQPYWDKVDLVIWPETAIPAYAHRLEPFLDLMREQAVNNDAQLVLGLATYDSEMDRYHNSLIAFGQQKDTYHKRHLVPFGEYLPLKSLLDPFLAFLQIPMSNFTPGQAERPLLHINGIAAGVSICYEDAFGEEVIEALPEAGILINVSNDAWFGDSIAPHQHLQMARFRALEAGRYMLRATNTGISAVINTKGQITAQSPQFLAHALPAKVRLYNGTTPYVIVGNYATVIICILSLFMVLLINNRRGSTESQQ